MCNVSIMDDDGNHKNVVATNNETINDILRHLHINPDTKIVYKNGKILSREKMEKCLPDSGTVHLVIKRRSIRI